MELRHVLWKNIASCYLAIPEATVDDWNAAESVLNLVLNTAPNDFQALMQRGLAHKLKGVLVEAKQDFRKALAEVKRQMLAAEGKKDCTLDSLQPLFAMKKRILKEITMIKAEEK